MRWTDRRKKHLQKNYCEVPTELLAELYNIRPRSVHSQALRYGAKKKKKWQLWTTEEEQELKAWGYPVTRQLARTFNRSPGACRDKLRELLRGKKTPSKEV